MVTGPATTCPCIASEQLPPKPPGVPARPPPKRSPPSRRVAPLTGGSPPRGAHRPSRRRRFPRTDVATTGIRGPGRQRLIRQLCRNLYSCTNSWRRPNCHGGWLPPEPPGAPARTNHSADTRQRSSTRSKLRTGCSLDHNSLPAQVVTRQFNRVVERVHEAIGLALEAEGTPGGNRILARMQPG